MSPVCSVSEETHRDCFPFLEIVIRIFEEKVKALNQRWQEGALPGMPGESLPELWARACP